MFGKKGGEGKNQIRVLALLPGIGLQTLFWLMLWCYNHLGAYT
jgi:hypothetical protein